MKNFTLYITCILSIGLFSSCGFDEPQNYVYCNEVMVIEKAQVENSTMSEYGIYAYAVRDQDRRLTLFRTDSKFNVGVTIKVVKQ